VRIDGRPHARVRSYGMNWSLASERGTEVEVVREYGEIQDPSPSRMFVFIDQHPDYISDPHFHMSLAAGRSSMFMDLPSSSHDGSGVLTFADGHAERRKWVDTRTKPEFKNRPSAALYLPSPHNEDIVWLQERYAAPLGSK
jgi:prepilin-type processing-associated H-X9-DG protein